MEDFEIIWIHDPVVDIISIGQKDPGCSGFVCGTFCMEKTPDSCNHYCIGEVTLSMGLCWWALGWELPLFWGQTKPWGGSFLFFVTLLVEKKWNTLFTDNKKMKKFKDSCYSLRRPVGLISLRGKSHCPVNTFRRRPSGYAQSNHGL